MKSPNLIGGLVRHPGTTLNWWRCGEEAEAQVRWMDSCRG
jgi:hypothetical protein